MSKTTVRTFPTHIDLAADIRDEMIDLLNQHLADAFDLYSQTKQAHWNIKGMEFIALHKLFDEFAENLEDHIDTIAERVTAFGGLALGTARMAANASRLPEYPSQLITGKEHVEALVERYALFGKTVREAIDHSAEVGDIGTSDLFTGISRDIDKHLWFLEAHIQD